MATGLKVPVGVDKSGGANVISDDVEHTKQLLFLALSEGGDDNPFQRLGIENLAHAIRNASFRGRAQRAVMSVISKYSDRVALAPDTPIKFTETEDNEIELSFEYVDLSESKIQDFRKTFTA